MIRNDVQITGNNTPPPTRTHLAFRKDDWIACNPHPTLPQTHTATNFRLPLHFSKVKMFLFYNIYLPFQYKTLIGIWVIFKIHVVLFCLAWCGHQGNRSISVWIKAPFSWTLDFTLCHNCLSCSFFVLVFFIQFSGSLHVINFFYIYIRISYNIKL